MLNGFARTANGITNRRKHFDKKIYYGTFRILCHTVTMDPTGWVHVSGSTKRTHTWQKTITITRRV